MKNRPGLSDADINELLEKIDKVTEGLFWRHFVFIFQFNCTFFIIIWSQFLCFYWKFSSQMAIFELLSFSRVFTFQTICDLTLTSQIVLIFRNILKFIFTSGRCWPGEPLERGRLDGGADPDPVRVGGGGHLSELRHERSWVLVGF